MADEKLIGVCQADWCPGERCWWPADSTEERCPQQCDCEPVFYAPVAERDEALLEVTKMARRLGEAEGKLEASEWPGVVEGWKRKCEDLLAAVESHEKARDAADRLILVDSSIARMSLERDQALYAAVRETERLVSADEELTLREKAEAERDEARERYRVGEGLAREEHDRLRAALREIKAESNRAEAASCDRDSERFPAIYNLAAAALADEGERGKGAMSATEIREALCERHAILNDWTTVRSFAEAEDLDPTRARQVLDGLVVLGHAEKYDNEITGTKYRLMEGTG